jgi:MFS family permease
VISKERTAEPDDGRRQRLNLAVIVSAQGLYVLIVSVDLTLTGLVGYRIAPSHSLATLPFALIFIAGTLSTSPAALLMARVGPRAGFMVGAATAGIGGLVCVWALAADSFLLFCIGTAFVGAYQGFAVYYKYTAADEAPPERRARVVSYVVGAGVVAAVAGPFLATASRHLLAVAFAGAYAVTSVLALASIAALLGLRISPPARSEPAEPEAGEHAPEPPRPLRVVLTQPLFVVGVLGAAVAYFVMMLLMTVAPIAGELSHHSAGQNALVIQWHLIGMFAPSLVSGLLVERFGAPPVLLAGTGLAAVAAAFDVAGTGQGNFLLALGGIGVAWNLMLVSGTTLVIQSYRQAERTAAQAAAESITAVAATLGALTSGVLLDAVGWQNLNLVALCALAVPALLTLSSLAAPGRTRVPGRRPPEDATTGSAS